MTEPAPPSPRAPVQPARCRWSSPHPARGKPPVHLADLSTDARKAALQALGQPAFRADQVARHYFGNLTRDAGRDDRPPERHRAAIADGDAAGAADPGPQPRHRRRRHPQDAVAGPRRHADRVGADALPGPRHAVRLLAGRLRDGLPVLRHRPGRPGPQPVDRRDRRAGPPRRPGRPATASSATRTGCPTSSSWGWGSRSPTTSGCSRRSSRSPRPTRTAWASRPARSPSPRSACCRPSTS